MLGSGVGLSEDTGMDVASGDGKILGDALTGSVFAGIIPCSSNFFSWSLSIHTSSIQSCFVVILSLIIFAIFSSPSWNTTWKMSLNLAIIALNNPPIIVLLLSPADTDAGAIHKVGLTKTIIFS